MELRGEEGETGWPRWFLGKTLGGGGGVADVVGYDAEGEWWCGQWYRRGRRLRAWTGIGELCHRC